MIYYNRGDIIHAFNDDRIDILVHGCNCQKQMGAGLAKQIRYMFPEAYEADLIGKCDPKYREQFIEADTDSSKKLGLYTMTNYFGGYDRHYKFIINGYTQNYPGKQTDLFSLYRSFYILCTHLKEDFANFPNLKIGMPKIGCGLAGGEWHKMEVILSKVFTNRDIFVYTLY